MAYFGSKGYFVKKLKENGIRYIEGHKVEKFKSHILQAKLKEVEKNK